MDHQVVRCWHDHKGILLSCAGVIFMRRSTHKKRDSARPCDRARARLLNRDLAFNLMKEKYELFSKISLNASR